MSEYAECRTCLTAISDPETCEVCGDAVCPECACYDEDLLHVRCEACVDAWTAAQEAKKNPSAAAVLYQLASLATIARLGRDTEQTANQLRSYLKDFDPTYLRTLAASLTALAPDASGVSQAAK